MSHLLVLQFDAHHSEGVVGSVVVDVDAAEALLSRLDGHPLLTGIVIDHHRGPRLADTLFTDGREGGREYAVSSVECGGIGSSVSPLIKAQHVIVIL